MSETLKSLKGKVFYMEQQLKEARKEIERLRAVVEAAEALEREHQLLLEDIQGHGWKPAPIELQSPMCQAIDGIVTALTVYRQTGDELTLGQARKDAKKFMEDMDVAREETAQRECEDRS